VKELLGSPIWQFVGVILAFLAIILSVGIYYKQRQFKSLSYAISSITQLLNVHNEVRRRVKILYDDQPVQDVHLAIIELFNSGNVPITSTDYDHPVIFDFGVNARILSSEIIRTIPSNLPASIEVQAKLIIFANILLNPEDSITVKVLLSGFEDRIAVTGRVHGVKEILKAMPSETRAKFRTFLIIDFIGAFVVIFIALSILIFSKGQLSGLAGVITVGGLLGVGHEVWKDYKKFIKNSR
jgi:hypothetical protein